MLLHHAPLLCIRAIRPYPLSLFSNFLLHWIGKAGILLLAWGDIPLARNIDKSVSLYHKTVRAVKAHPLDVPAFFYAFSPHFLSVSANFARFCPLWPGYP
jgi:hypothetical protein